MVGTNSCQPYLCKNLLKMEVAKKSRTKNWIYFFIWLVIMVAMLILPDWRPYFWLALPGVVTHFAYGMDLID